MRQWVMEFTLSTYRFLLPIAWVVLGVSIAVLLPLCAWRKTRASAAGWLLASSYIIGITTWFLGAGITFASFGWFGLIIGLLILGVGVVPLGIVGAFFKLDANGLALSILVMLVVTFSLRFAAIHFVEKADT